MEQIKVEDRYKEMSEIDHILHRPGMYVGSTKNEKVDKFVFSHSEHKMEQVSIEYVPAMMKIMDEVISNSCDEFRRETNLGLNEIQVEMDKSGLVKVRDNGGIPVVMHQTAGCYVPEFIFGRFRTSSNYDDSENRNWVGTNGVGSKYANVYSTQFTIHAADAKKSFFRSWQNNMRVINDDLKIEDCSDHFLETTFNLDFSKFTDYGENAFTFMFARMVEKRCIDAAAANPGLKVTFKYTVNNEDIISSEWKFNDFQEYMELYSDYVELNNCISFSTNKQQCWVYPDGNISIGFVNGCECSKGTHISSLRYDINNAVTKYLKTEHDIEVSTKSVDNKYSLFCMVDVSNPAYTSQTKEELDTPANKFDKATGKKYIVPLDFLIKIQKSEITSLVLDWYKDKQQADDRKATRKMNKMLKNKVRSDKFINANSRDRQSCELWIFEGASAKSGFRAARTPQTQAAYMLRGVIKNVLGASQKEIMANQELRDLVSIIGLQFGVRNNTSKLQFGRLVIATDADHDGDKIAGLLLVFFNTFWPELIEDGLVCRALSPIMTATKGKEVKEYYSFDDYKKDEPNLSGYHIKYTKGLGGLASHEYKKMMQQPKFHFFTKDELTNQSIDIWFGGSARKRKEQLSADVC